MKTKRRCAFTLIEILAAIILSIAVLTVSTAILVNSIKTIGDANKHMTQARSLDAAIAQLRADAWSSAQFTQFDAATLELHSPGGPEITWTLLPNLVLRRSQARPGQAPIVRNFASMPSGLILTAHDKMILLQSQDSSGRPATVTLPSQLLLAGGQP